MRRGYTPLFVHAELNQSAQCIAVAIMGTGCRLSERLKVVPDRRKAGVSGRSAAIVIASIAAVSKTEEHAVAANAWRADELSAYASGRGRRPRGSDSPAVDLKCALGKLWDQIGDTHQAH